MKRLYILRHAQTFPSSAQGDRERVLTPQGLEEARALGRTMKAQNLRPDYILCSPAQRTRQTLAQILNVTGDIAADYPKIIYEGGVNDLMKLIRGAGNEHAALLLVGHNPAIHQFAASLAQDDGNPLLNRLAIGYAPGTLTVLDVPRPRWADLQAGENRLVDLIAP